MLVRQVFDEKLAQYAYLVGCPATGEAAVIDPERDIDRYLDLAERNNLTIVAAFDTHIHADYLSGLREFAERGVMIYASDEGAPDWRYEWLLHSSYRYQLVRHGDRFRVGNITFEVMHTPGHTPEHVAFLVEDGGSGSEVPIALVTGDFVFVGDLGRPDLLETAAGMVGTMEKGARVLYDSVAAFRRLPEFLQLWPAHGAGSACGKSLGDIPISTVGYELRNNPAILAAGSPEAFVRYILAGQPEPPIYFARMKRDNRGGPRVLAHLPQPKRLAAADLAALSGRTDVAVVDTRVDRSAFMAHHLAASLYAPLDRTFPTVTGSYVDEHLPVYLIIEEERVEEAVRDLVRIGYDHIEGFATPETLERYLLGGGHVRTTDELTFEQARRQWEHEGAQVLDVRGAAEFDADHIPGALNIAHTRLEARLSELPTHRKLLVHCRSGARAAVATAFLEREGFEVAYVNDHFDHWQRLARGEAAAVTV